MKRKKAAAPMKPASKESSAPFDEELIKAWVDAFHRNHSPTYLLDEAEKLGRWVRENGSVWKDEVRDPAQAIADAKRILVNVQCARNNLEAGNHQTLAGFMFWIGRSYESLWHLPIPDEVRADVERGRKVKSGAGTGGPKPMSEADIRARSEAWRPFVVAEMVSPKVKPWAAAGRAAKTIQKKLKLQKPPGQRSVYDYVFNSEKLIEKARKKAAKRRRKD